MMTAVKVMDYLEPHMLSKMLIRWRRLTAQRIAFNFTFLKSGSPLFMELKNNSVGLSWLSDHQRLIISPLRCMLSISTGLGLRELHNYADVFQQHAK